MYLNAESYAAYNAPIVLLIFIVIGLCMLWLAVLALLSRGVQPQPTPPIVAPVHTPSHNLPTVLNAGFWLRACCTVVRAAMHQVTLALRGHTRSPQDQELGSLPPSTDTIDAPPACPLPATPPGIPAQETTPSSRPDLNPDASGLSPTGNAAHPAFIATTSPESMTDASTSTLSVDATPWPSFVAPWDLIAASSTPRASTDLGHSLQGSGAHLPP